jgi:hypothetical protein
MDHEPGPVRGDRTLAFRREVALVENVLTALAPVVVTLLLGFVAAWHHDFAAKDAAVLYRMVCYMPCRSRENARRIDGAPDGALLGFFGKASGNVQRTDGMGTVTRFAQKNVVQPALVLGGLLWLGYGGTVGADGPILLTSLAARSKATRLWTLVALALLAGTVLGHESGDSALSQRKVPRNSSSVLRHRPASALTTLRSPIAVAIACFDSTSARNPPNSMVSIFQLSMSKTFEGDSSGLISPMPLDHFSIESRSFRKLGVIAPCFTMSSPSRLPAAIHAVLRARE